MKHGRREENAYRNMQIVHQTELDTFPSIYAQDEAHVGEIMEVRGLKPRPVYDEAQVGEIMGKRGLKFRRCAVLNFGGGKHYYLRSDMPKLRKMLQRHRAIQEKCKALAQGQAQAKRRESLALRTFEEGCPHCDASHDYQYRDGKVLYRCKTCKAMILPCNVCTRPSEPVGGCRHCTNEKPNFKPNPEFLPVTGK